jgi:hypothetical protein
LTEPSQRAASRIGVGPFQTARYATAMPATEFSPQFTRAGLFGRVINFAQTDHADRRSLRAAHTCPCWPGSLVCPRRTGGTECLSIKRHHRRAKRSSCSYPETRVRYVAERPVLQRLSPTPCAQNLRFTDTPVSIAGLSNPWWCFARRRFNR